MNNSSINRFLLSLLGVALLGFAAPTFAAPPFGGEDSVAYAAKLWGELEKAGLVGKHATWSRPYKGTPPHGKVLDTIHGSVKVGGHTGAVIIKRNYGGKGVSVANVANDPAHWLKAVTVMFKREKGYDADDKDWFWGKFKADGGILKNPKGMKLVGRVAKGKPKGCIACHKAAPGGDFVYGWDIK